MSTLAPISLAELTAAAELQTRVDRKYVLTRAQAGTVLAGLAPDTRVLESCEPIYEMLPGWKAPTAGVRDWAMLPANARRYAASPRKNPS